MAPLVTSLPVPLEFIAALFWDYVWKNPFLSSFVLIFQFHLGNFLFRWGVKYKKLKK